MLDAVARAEWARVAPLLAAEGLLNRLDRSVFVAYCLAWSRLIAAQTALADGGPMTVPGSHGGSVPRVELRIARDATAALARLADALGLSPASRARLGVGQAADGRGADLIPPELLDVEDED